jgi:SAM-dependent methyltransferase
MQAYGSSFARIYNMRWGNFANRAAPLLRAYYEGLFPGETARHRLLDLCCGTGQLSLHFLDNGYQVTGIDLSPAMLEYARQNCAAYIVTGQARFLQADAASYEVDNPVDLVISTFDALNHLPDLAALRGCFQSTFSALRPGGVFIFDLNTRLGLRRWATGNIEENPDLTLFTFGLYEEGSGKAHTRISGFLRAEDGRYDRFEETAYNCAFNLDEVQNILLEVGFKHAHFANLTDLAKPLDQPELENRVFFAAAK